MAQADDSPASTPPGDDPTPPDDGSAAPPPPPTVAPPAATGLVGLVVTAVAVLACGLGIAFLIERYLAPPRDSGDNPGAVVPTEKPTAAVESTLVRDVTPPKLPDLAARLDKLSRQVEAIQARLDAQARSGPPPEVAALQVRVADLTTSANNLTPLLSKVDHLSNRVDDLSGEVTTLRDELTTQSRPAATPRPTPSAPTPRVPAATPTPTPTPISTTTATPTPLPDARRAPAALADPNALSAVADLYRRGKYKEAREALAPIARRYPDDARVWYYAALCTGFTTRDWATDAVQLVQKGIAREEAGTARTADIDAEFKGLTTSSGKDWLSGYRKRVKAKPRG